MSDAIDTGCDDELDPRRCRLLLERRESSAFPIAADDVGYGNLSVAARRNAVVGVTMLALCGVATPGLDGY